MKRDKALESFHDKCTHLVPHKQHESPRPRDFKSFDCAYYHFCPDFCRNWLIKLPKNELRLLWYQSDPCLYAASAPCRYDAENNISLSDLKKNNVNISCKCAQGFKFNTQYASCVDIDECLSADNVCYSRNLTCLNNAGSYSCNCPRGFTLSKNSSCVRSSKIERLENLTDKYNHFYQLEEIAKLINSN